MRTVTTTADGAGNWSAAINPPLRRSDFPHGATFRARQQIGAGWGPYSEPATVAVPQLAQTTALLARMTPAPDAARIDLIDNLFHAIGPGVLARLDALYVLAAHHEQAGRLNWVQDAYNLTAVNSPGFTIDRGWTGDGVASDLSIGVNAPALWPDAGASGVSMGVVSLSDSASSGAVMGNSSRLHIWASNITFSARGLYNAVPLAITQSDGRGHFAVVREDASVVKLYRSGVVVATGSQPVVNNDSADLRILGRNGGNFWQGTAGAAYLGRGLTGAEMATLHAALTTYLTSIGAIA